MSDSGALWLYLLVVVLALWMSGLYLHVRRRSRTLPAVEGERSVAVARRLAIAFVAVAVWFTGVAIVDGDDLATVVGVTFNVLVWVMVVTYVVRWVKRRRTRRGPT